MTTMTPLSRLWQWFRNIGRTIVNELLKAKREKGARPRGYCVWCQGDIMANHPAGFVCYGCPDYRVTAEDQTEKYIHWKCAMESGCAECNTNKLIRAQ